MQRDAQDFAKKFQKWQRRRDKIHTSHRSLHPTMALYPFHSWGLYFIGSINPLSERCTWILVAIELFTKWVEAVVMRKPTGSLVANFLRDSIVCHFGAPNKIISDIGTAFLNKDVCHLTKWYSISHTTSTPYYPKGNGQAKASNKRLPKILRKMTKEHGKGWEEELPTTLWAQRTAKSQVIEVSPFSLVYDM